MKTLHAHFDDLNEFEGYYLLDRPDAGVIDLQAKSQMMGKGSSEEDQFQDIVDEYNGKLEDLKVEQDGYSCYVNDNFEGTPPKGHRLFEHYNIILNYPPTAKATEKNLGIIAQILDELDDKIIEILTEKIEELEAFAEKNNLDLDISLS